jgi:hypothetical protein
MKKDWHPFKGLELAILFSGSGKWTRGQIVAWGKYSFKFLSKKRKRPMDYMRYEIRRLAIVVNGDQEKER